MEGRLKESLEKKDDDTSEAPNEEDTGDDSTPFIDIYVSWKCMFFLTFI